MTSAGLRSYMGHLLAADGSQNGKYVSLAHESGAAAGKPTYYADGQLTRCCGRIVRVVP
jgi:hypothetical protein